MTDPAKDADQNPLTFAPEHDRRIFEGYLGDREAMFRELGNEGFSKRLVVKRAEALGLSASFLARCEAGGVDIAVRDCLACDQPFVSQGRQNRLCKRCRHRS